jgi:hypothetical protein
VASAATVRAGATNGVGTGAAALIAGTLRRDGAGATADRGGEAGPACERDGAGSDGVLSVAPGGPVTGGAGARGSGTLAATSMAPDAGATAGGDALACGATAGALGAGSDDRCATAGS